MFGQRLFGKEYALNIDKEKKWRKIQFFRGSFVPHTTHDSIVASIEPHAIVVSMDSLAEDDPTLPLDFERRYKRLAIHERVLFTVAFCARSLISFENSNEILLSFPLIQAQILQNSKRHCHLEPVEMLLTHRLDYPKTPT